MQAQIADEVWEYSDITKYSVDTERGIFKIADSKYSYDADLFVESNGEKIRLSDLNEKDKIRVVGIGTKNIIRVRHHRTGHFGIKKYIRI